MNILHINQNLSVAGGGVAQMIRDYSPALESRGVSVYALTGEDIKTVPQGIKEHFYCPAVNMCRDKKGSWKKTLSDIIEESDIDIVHIHEVRNFEIIEYVVGRLPVAIHMHNYGWWCPGTELYYGKTEEICPLSTGWKCIPNAYLKQCNNRHPKHLFPSVRNAYRKRKIWSKNVGFITSSEYMRDRGGRAGIPPEKIFVVPYAVEENRFRQNDLKAVESLQPGFLLYVGRLACSKGVHYLLRAIAMIGKNYTHTVIAGGGLNQSSLEEYARSLNLRDSVTFLGWREGDELSWLYKNCSMLVVPSIWDEVFGIIGLEAMASSKPVVAFDVGGISQWLRDGETGYLVGRKDVEGLANKIRYLLDNSDERKLLGKNGKARFHEEYTTAKQTGNLIDVYKNIIKLRDN